MEEIAGHIGTTVKLDTDFDDAVLKVTEALKREGFGVLTEIDVKETLRNKLNVDFRRYKILGACNPTLAYQALSAAPQVGLLLPCNVTVAEAEDGEVEVSFVNPMAMLGVIPGDQLKAIADEATTRLERVRFVLLTK